MVNTKTDLFQTICNASRLGTLGFFVGAGFSKAVLDGNKRYKSYKWGELLQACCNKLEIDKKVLDDYCSYPELATKICKNFADKEELSYDEAVKKFKSKICELVNSYPEQRQRENYERWFKSISPSWIATTNYDMLIESVLGGIAFPISPNGCFCSIRGMIPVFHLHGICNEPDEIIITNEDYAYMFRPNDYRQARLPFLMKESCVLMIGYGLGDINVITAVDWANNVYTNVNDGYDFPIIQLLYTDNPKTEPYMGKDNVIIYEIGSLDVFLAELCEFMSGYKEENNSKVQIVASNMAYLSNTEESNILNFINNINGCRSNILNFFSGLEPEFGYAYNNFFPFIRVVLAKLDDLARPSGAFEAYNIKLCLILDILISIPIKKIPTSFFEMLASELNSVGYYLDPQGSYRHGESYRATDSWKTYKVKMPQEVVNELWRFTNSSQYDYTWLRLLLKSI